MPSEPKDAPDLSPAVVRDEATTTQCPASRSVSRPGVIPHRANVCQLREGHTGRHVDVDGVEWTQDVEAMKRRLADFLARQPELPKNDPRESASPVSVPEKRQDEARVATADELRAFLRNLRIDSRAGDGGRIARLASALDALAVAVKGCGHGCVTGPRYGGCGTVVEGRRLLCYFCARKRDAAVDSLLDGRTTT